MRIALIACCGAKLNREAPARELYRSCLFRKSLRYAEENADKIFILSAKHGMVASDKMIKPYDVSLNGQSKQYCKQWGAKVDGQLMKLFKSLSIAGTPVNSMLILAGKSYREPIDFLKQGFWVERALRGVSIYDFEVEVPMEGMGIGQQLSWLTPTEHV